MRRAMRESLGGGSAPARSMLLASLALGLLSAWLICCLAVLLLAA